MSVEYGDTLTAEELAALEINLDENGEGVMDEPTADEIKPADDETEPASDLPEPDAEDDTTDTTTKPSAEDTPLPEVVIPTIATVVRPDVVEPVDSTDALKELADKYDAGDLTLAEYTAEANKLNAQNVLAEQSKQMQAHFDKQDWANTTSAFFNSNPQFDQEKNPVMYDLFHARYNRLIASEESLSGIDALVKAAEQTVKDVAALTPAVKKDTKVKPQKAKPTQTLADIPSAKEGETSDNKFSDLDALDGEAFEMALQKLTPAQQREYLSA